ncbi:MAG: hypothetical protein LC112_12750 [Flavobacteriales bacterium]|nr:hypothetical protein [Flavobacteriales bacterium]
MKRFLLLTFFCFFTIVFAQDNTNRFDDDSQSAFENTNRETADPKNEGPIANKNPGNPGAPVPIDQYAAGLLITALGIIVYKTRRKRNLLS